MDVTWKEEPDKNLMGMTIYRCLLCGYSFHSLDMDVAEWPWKKNEISEHKDVHLLYCKRKRTFADMENWIETRGRSHGDFEIYVCCQKCKWSFVSLRPRYNSIGANEMFEDEIIVMDRHKCHQIPHISYADYKDIPNIKYGIW